MKRIPYHAEKQTRWRSWQVPEPQQSTRRVPCRSQISEATTKQRRESVVSVTRSRKAQPELLKCAFLPTLFHLSYEIQSRGLRKGAEQLTNQLTKLRYERSEIAAESLQRFLENSTRGLWKKQNEKEMEERIQIMLPVSGYFFLLQKTIGRYGRSHSTHLHHFGVIQPLAQECLDERKHLL